jgi:hypothetical protein
VLGACGTLRDSVYATEVMISTMVEVETAMSVVPTRMLATLSPTSEAVFVLPLWHSGVTAGCCELQ